MGKRSSCLALALLVLPASAFADRHKAGFSAGYRNAERSDLRGAQFAAEKTLNREGEGLKNTFTWSLLGEAGFVAGEHDGTTLADLTVLGGGRLTLNGFGKSKEGGHARYRRFQPSVKALIGFDWAYTDEWRTSFAGAFGFGLDVPLGSLGENAHPTVALRAEIDRYWKPEWYTQISVSVVFRINHPDPCKPSPSPCPTAK